MLSLAPRRTCTTGEGSGRVRVERGTCRRSTESPTTGAPTCRASLVTCRGGSQPVQRGQICPLILVGFQRGQVQEHRCTVAMALAVQRGSDQVPDSRRRQHILGGEQPVVAGEVHPSAQADRLTHQPCSQLPAHNRGHRVGKEAPDMCAGPRPRYLQRRRRTCGSRGFQVGQGVQHRRRAIEVRSEPAASVARQQRVETDVHRSQQVLGEDLACQREVRLVPGARALAPPAGDRRHPTGATSACVLPTDRVHIRAGAEQRGEERDLCLRW